MLFLFKKNLLDLLKKRSFKKGEYVLSSGYKSDYYIDCRLTSISSEGVYLIGEIFFQITKDLDAKAIGGPETGSIPLTTATVLSYHRHNLPMEGFWTRNKTKEYGMTKDIEGNLSKNNSAIIIDDVFSTGQSTLRSVKIIQEYGCKVIKVLSLVDRLQGAKKLFSR